MSFNTPILLLVFNRPNETKQLINVLETLKPKFVYVVRDGPRNERDVLKCEEVKHLLTNLPWDCELRSIFRDENLGCANSVSKGISWFFTQEEEGIILEDDCIPDLSFFSFCRELLDYYRDHHNIFHISGNNFQYGKKRGAADYYFSVFNHLWGWATWKRAWEHFEYDINITKQNEILDFVKNREMIEYFNQQFEITSAGNLDSWGFRWTHACWVNHGISILPNQNLVSNIGFGLDSTHTTQIDSIQSKIPVKPIKTPLIHPSEVKINKRADFYSFRKIFKAKKTLRHHLGDLKRKLLK